jgi:hypothetical protein
LPDQPDPDAPPTVITASSVVVAYATIDDDVGYSGAIHLLVDGQLLGPVPRLVISREAESNEVLLLHCDSNWQVLGTSLGGTSVASAKERAERGYPGLRPKWVDMPRSPEEIAKLVRESWAGQACSFCGRIPLEVGSVIQGSDARVCNICIEKFHRQLLESPTG